MKIAAQRVRGGAQRQARANGASVSRSLTTRVLSLSLPLSLSPSLSLSLFERDSRCAAFNVCVRLTGTYSYETKVNTLLNAIKRGIGRNGTFCRRVGQI